jgi:hypothetical protein
MVFTRPVLFRVARIVGVAVLTRLTDVFPIPLSTAHVIAAPDRAASTRQVVTTQSPPARTLPAPG